MSILPTVSEHIESTTSHAIFVLTATVSSDSLTKAQETVVKTLQELLCDDIGSDVFYRIAPKDWRLLNRDWVQSPDHEKLASPQVIGNDSGSTRFAVDVVFELSSENSDRAMFEEMKSFDLEVNEFNKHSDNVKLNEKQYPNGIKTALYGRCQTDEPAEIAQFNVTTDLILSVLHGIKHLTKKQFKRAVIRPATEDLAAFPATTENGIGYQDVLIRLFDSGHFQWIVESDESISYLSDIIDLNNLLAQQPPLEKTDERWLYSTVSHAE